MQKKSQQKNFVIPVFIATLFITIGILTFYFLKFADFNEMSLDLEDSQSFASSLSEEKIKQKLLECDQKPKINQKDWCYLDLAKKYNINCCEYIIQKNFQNFCTAIINQDYELCKDVVNKPLMDACYIHIAQKTQNKRICDKSSRKNYCLSLVS